jgi:uncharacterized membrane protein (UPF0127 family)
MRKVHIVNLSRPSTSPLTVGYASTFITQLRGLTFRRSIPYEEGLLLVQSRDSRLDSSIHMLGVFTDLAVVWINSNYEVVDACLARSWRPAYIPARPSRYVLEMNPARLGDFRPGDKVRIEEI